MIKYESFDTEDLEFVDPHVIQPIIQPTFQDLIGDQEPNSVLSASQDDSSSSACENSDIRMEQCINLDLYLSPITGTYMETTSDELNTPVFATTTKDLNVLNIIDVNGNPFTFPIRVKSEEYELGTINQQSQTTTDTPSAAVMIDFNETSVVHSDLTNSSLLSPDNALIMDEVDLNEYDLLSDCDEAIMQNINDIINMDSGNIIIGNSEDCLEAAEAYSQTTSLENFELKLDLTTKFDAPAVLQTPDVINTICSIEKDFDIFKYCNAVKSEYELPAEDAIELVSQPSPPSCSNQSTTSTYPESTTTLFELTPTTSKQLFLKLHERSDDDEDYVPPSLKKTKTKRRRSTVVTDSDYAEEVVVKRGRPAKRSSVSSENSTGTYRYREMRDKNNEASRKSREKRKMKEQHYESEMSELEANNIRLKAEVEQLERTVSTFRTNLMQLLLKK